MLNSKLLQWCSKVFEYFFSKNQSSSRKYLLYESFKLLFIISSTVVKHVPYILYQFNCPPYIISFTCSISFVHEIVFGAFVGSLNSHVCLVYGEWQQFDNNDCHNTSSINPW